MNWKPIKQICFAALCSLSAIALIWTYRMQVHHTSIEWYESGSVVGFLIGYGILLLYHLLRQVFLRRERIQTESAETSHE